MTPQEDVLQLALGSLLGRYMIVRRCGAASRVFVAVDPVLNRQVALKVYSVPALGGAARAALLLQARAVAKVAHPNVVAVHDAGEVGDLLFVAMDLVDGPTLRTWQQAARRSRNELRTAYVQVIDALLALEAAGLAQPPFDPEVALVGADGRVRLLDRAQTPTGAREVDLAALLFAAEYDAEVDETTLSSASIVATVSGSVGERAGTSVAAATPSSPASAATVSGPVGERAGTSVAAASPSSPASEATVSGRVGERAGTGVAGAPGPELTQATPSSPERERLAMRRDAAVASDLSATTQMHAVCAALAEAPAAPSLGDPGRFATLQALRAALVVRRAPVGARLAAVALVLAAIVGLLASREQRTICQGAAARVDTVLGPERRAALAAHVQSLGPDGPEAWGLIDRQLTSLLAAWAGMYQDSCEATRLRREQTDAVFSSRSACLERRLVEVSAALEVLESTTTASLNRAVDALAAVAPLSVCADVEALSRHSDAPESPSLAGKVSALDRAYAHASALYEAGREPEAYAEAQAVVANARALPWPSKEALALALLGELVRTRGTPEAESVLREAFRKCLATHEDAAAVGAATALSYVLARRGDIAPAKEWLWQGQSLAARLGANPLLQARIELRAASLAFFQSDFPEAKKHAELAHSLRRELLGDDHALTLSALFNVANALNGEHHFEEALALQRQIFESISTTHGLSYPLTGQSATGLAELFYNLRRYDEAVAIIDRVLPAQRRTFGDDSLQVARLLLNQSNALTKTGRAETSLGLLTQARSIFDQQHALRLQGLALDSQGEAYGSLGRLKEAHDAFEQSRALLSKAFGPNEDAVLTTTESEGEVLLANGHLAEAATLFERALAARTSQQQSDMVGYDLSFLGRVHARLGLVDRAKEELAKAIDLLEASQTDAWALAETKAAYAALINPAIPSEGAR